MFGLSFLEIITIIVVAFIVFGPEQFPMMVKKIFQIIGTVKKYAAQAQEQMHTMTRDLEKEVSPTQWSAESPKLSSPNTQQPTVESVVIKKQVLYSDWEEVTTFSSSPITSSATSLYSHADGWEPNALEKMGSARISG